MKLKSSNHSRRDFIKRSSLFAIGVSLTTFPSCKDDKDPGTDVSDNCQTTDDILGPFYKAGAPFSENIIPDGVDTEPLIVEGNVFFDCSVPVPDAIVEIWNADEEGNYDSSDNFRFRGRFQTEANGLYRFTTIIPGRYLNGSTYRPSHIHFRITAPGYLELVSQIYFRDDPFIPTDPWASADKAKERILPVSKDNDGTDIITFDIHMKKSS